MIELTLPFPPSANRYWRTAVRGSFVNTYVSAEAKEFKAQVGRICRAAGICTPLLGRVAVAVELYPQRPQDWVKRMRQEGATWDDSVRCIDLDNANKVLLDAIKGLVIEDDKWVRRLSSERMEPDGEGRVVVRITPLVQHVHPQADLLGAAA